jgi:hypothetical protein
MRRIEAFRWLYLDHSANTLRITRNAMTREEAAVRLPDATMWLHASPTAPRRKRFTASLALPVSRWDARGNMIRGRGEQCRCDGRIVSKEGRWLWTSTPN